RGVLACQLVPVFCGSSLRNRGVQPLLDAVLDYLPSPLDVPPAQGLRPPKEGEDGEGETEERPPSEDAPFSALVFKVMMDEGRRLTYLRVYSGKLASGAPAYNTARQVSERAARLFHMYSHKRERIEEVGPGDIAAAAGFKHAATGDTLCDEEHPIAFEPIRAPHPVISIAVEARDSAGARKLEEALKKLEAEDPTFRARRDPDTGQVVMSGMGELHLDVLTRRIGEEFGVEVRVGKPRVVYRETIQRPDEAEATYDRELAGKPQFARVRVRVAPAPGKGFSCESGVRALEEGGTLPRKLLQAALESLRASAGGGPMAGYEMTGVHAELADAHYDPARGTEAAFSLAASHAFIEACRRAGGVLLEPVMAVEAVTPEEFTGAVIGDLNARGGRIGQVEERGGDVPLQIVRASVPLARMFGYSTALRSATQGRATFTMEFARYAKSETAGV
ncbi:MAG: elongation factor G, partial [Candidatus Tectomicrobia bacterium]|nr:elongation factor G [Candidatus Tectomicrobia bacterium]